MRERALNKRESINTSLFQVLFIVESVRDWGILGALRKRCRHQHLPFSRFHGVATYFISKIRKLYKLQHMLNNNLLINWKQLHLVEIILHRFDSYFQSNKKKKNTKLCFLVTFYPKYK